MNNDSLELVNSEKYYYFCIISQLPIWIIFFLNLITQNNKDDTFSEPNNHNYYLPARIFEPCDSCYLIKEQVWRLASYSLIHIDFNHLFLNSLALLIYSYINYFYPSKYLFFIYANGIIIGSLSFIFFNPYGILIGNSGGVYSLVGASLGSQIINFNCFQKDFNVILILFNILPIFLSWYHYYVMGSNKNTAEVSHLYGYIIGLLSSLMILPRFKEWQYHTILELVGIFGYIGLIIFFCYGYVILPYLDDSKFKDECCF